MCPGWNGSHQVSRCHWPTIDQMTKWLHDPVTQWEKKVDDKSDSDRKFPPGRSHPSDTWRLSPTWKNRSLWGRLLCHPVRCQVPQIIKSLQLTDLLTSGKGGVLTWSTFGRCLSGTPLDKFLVLVDLRLSSHNLRNFEPISIFSGFEQQQIWERSKRHPRRPGFQHQHYNFKIDIKGIIALLLFSWT